MALSGVHFACGSSGGSTVTGSGTGAPTFGFNVPIFGNLVWSETLVSPATTSNSAPANIKTPVIEVVSSADCYVAFGPSPNATTGPRVFVPASTVTDFLVRPGDRAAWIAA